MTAGGALPAFDPAVAQTLTVEEVGDGLLRILGFALLSAGTAAVSASLFRWYSRREIPEGVGVLIGLSIVAVWLNTRGALGDAIVGRTELLDPVTAVLTVATFVVGGISADVGRRAGDRLAREATAGTATPRNIDDVTQLVRSAGRVTSVDLPEEIEDVDGYDPVSAEIKADLAGRSLVFPRGLGAAELRSRLIDRLERDFGVGHVDCGVTADGDVEFLAVGGRPSGIGPTLAPGSIAIAIAADPAPDASPGDVVEVWHRAEGAAEPTRIGRAELRATAGDVATIVTEEDDLEELADERAYRLVTLPGTPDVARELVAVLRAADETVTTVAVEEGGWLAGTRTDDLSVTVLLVERGGERLPLPDGERLEPGDTAYVLGLPEELRRLEGR